MAIRAEGIAVFEQAVLMDGVHQRQELSSPAKAGDPVRRGFSVPSLTSLEYWIVRRSLSSGAHSRDPLADDDG